MCAQALKHAAVFEQSEIIFVNDSPAEKIDVSGWDHCTLIAHAVNRGIHASKLTGLRAAKGKYIHFLDQDDTISTHFYRSQLAHIGEDDLVVCNAVMEHATYSRKLYRSAFAKNAPKHPWAYVYLGDRVSSLGQCLMLKDSIPAYWTQHVMTHNGSDDYFLLLLMLIEKRKITTNPEVLFTHVYTSDNLSLDEAKLLASVSEAVALLKQGYPDNGLVKALDAKNRFERTGKVSPKTFVFWLIERLRRLSIAIRG